MKKLKFKPAFALAEVLITLGIIGVVAAMTLPSLIQDHREKETVVKLKKAYSVLSNAYMLAINKYETPDNWGLVTSGSGGNAGSESIYNKLAENLIITKYCGSGEGCFYRNEYKTLGTSVEAFSGVSRNFIKFVMADGISVAIWTSSADCVGSCGVMYVDTNGLRGPNTTGKDAFWLEFEKNRIVPYGNSSNMHNLFNNCINPTGSFMTSRGCTAWVLVNENLDYLHCKGLTWEGPFKCKDVK